MANKSIFEKTLQACRESVANAKAASKSAKKLTETTSSSIKKESDEGEEEDDIMMDIQDDIVAVVDPNIDADEMTDVALGFQQLIDDAGANEVPETDEYLGDNIYGCPVCGQKFFSDKPMVDGGKCPVCGEEADGFVSIGEVDQAEGEDKSGDSEGEETPKEDELDFSETDIEIDEEGKKARKESNRVRRSMRREGAMARRSVRRPSMARESRRVMGLSIDEKTFNPYLTKFIRENYENAMSFRVVGAKKKGNILTLECAIRFKSGKTKKTALVCNYNRKSNIMTAKDQGIFKVESKNIPFVFKIRTVGNVVRCEGMKYNFVTTAKVKNESKKVRVSSRNVTESRRVRRPLTRRAVESRRAIRRPVSRRVTESSKIRRPSVRRVGEARRVVPTSRKVRSLESRRFSRRPSVNRSVESRRVVRRPAAKRTVEGTSRLRRPVSRRSTMRAETLRRTRIAKNPAMRSESRMARRNDVSRRTARR